MKAQCEFCGATIRLNGFSNGDIVICFCGIEYLVTDVVNEEIVSMGSCRNEK